MLAWFRRIGGTGLSGRPAQWLAGGLAVLVACAAVLAPGERSGIAGFSVDSLFVLRDTAFGPRRQAAESPVAVVLIDEATYAVPPFKGTPKAGWGPHFAAVIQALNQAAPKAIGFDIILPTSLDQFQAGHERTFLLALRAAAEGKRMVMSKFQGQGPVIQPTRGQVMASGGAGNVRSVNLRQDGDGVIRSSPLRFPRAGGEGTETGFAYELALRAKPDLAALPGEDFLINFDGGMPFLTFSLADLLACAEAGNTEFFARHFRDRVVLVGTGLDAEDRLITSRRFINAGEKLTGPRCTPADEQVRFVDYPRITMPGVLVHAAAIDNLLRGEALRQPGAVARMAMVAGVAGTAGVAVLAAPLGWAAVALLGLVTAVAAAATLLMQAGMVTPMVEALAAALLTFGLLLAFRFAVSDRDKRRIRHMFGLYLAPSVIEKMIATGHLPALGGERRKMTFLFSDIASFTTMTEAADPAVLLPALNRYLEGLFEIVMKNGGLVMDFAGDGVIAIFGAPADMPDHAAHAVACAREMDDFTEAFRKEVGPTGLLFGHTRIGLHTGEATVGNFGAARRLKYTAMGDVVNAASRLEGLNKYFGTRVCMSQETRQASGDTDNRPLGSFVVKGKAQAIDVYQLLPPGADTAETTRKYRAAYEAQARGDAAAEALFAELAAAAPEDGAVEFHLGRARAGERTVRVLMDSK